MVNRCLRINYRYFVIVFVFVVVVATGKKIYKKKTEMHYKNLMAKRWLVAHIVSFVIVVFLWVLSTNSLTNHLRHRIRSNASYWAQTNFSICVLYMEYVFELWTRIYTKICFEASNSTCALWKLLLISIPFCVYVSNFL